MSDYEESPEDLRGTRVRSAVETFMNVVDSGSLVSLDQWLLSVDRAIRSDVEERCRDFLFAREALAVSGRPPTQLPEARDLGDYELLAVVGEGATGVVYEARQKSLNRRVAVKVLRPECALSDRQRRRFRESATTLASIDHAGIVRVLEVGAVEGRHYLVMEFVDGAPLSRRIAEAKKLGVDEAFADGFAIEIARIAEGAARALACAHQARVVHRDVKPGNIILTGEGETKIVDFGLAKGLSAAALSRTGEMIGTPWYMSPEQTRSSTVDHRSDIFSLGVVLYELCTLHRPFEDESVERLFTKIRDGVPPPMHRLNRRLPRDLVTICGKAMEKAPHHRYEFASELADDLARFARHEAILARPLPLHARAARAVVRRRATAIKAAALVLIGVSLIWGIGRWREGVRRDERLEPHRAFLETARQAGWWRKYDVGRLVGLKAEAEQLSAEGSQEAAAVVHVIDERGRALLGASTAALEESRGVEWSAGEAYRLPSETKLLRALLDLKDAALLLGGMEESERLLLRSAMASLSVDSEPPGADVYLQLVDFTTGVFARGEWVGRTPIRGLELAPGYYRVVVDVPGLGFAELTRWIAIRGRGYDLGTVAIRRTREVSGDMARIRPRRFTTGIESDLFPFYAPREHAALPAFLIDETEVSNREYAAFLAATRRDPPLHWDGDMDVDGRWGDLPVCRVTWLDARAYAEWVGKRLPTRLEWERAACGPRGFLFPWGDDSAALDDMNLAIGHPEIANLPSERHWQRFSELAYPTSQAGDDIGPEGLLHTYGNVREWTDTVTMLRTGEGPFPHMAYRLVKGSCVDRPRDRGFTLHTLEFDGPAAYVMAREKIGFRCAKSVAPFIE